MAALFGIAQSPEVALSAATTRTLLQILAPANQDLRVLRWGVFFDGVVAAGAPVDVELLRQTTAGTSTALTTLVSIGPNSGAIQVTGGHSFTSTEPTASDVIDIVEVHPQTGYEVIFPFGQEVFVTRATRIAIRATAPAVVNVRAKIWFEE